MTDSSCWCLVVYHSFGHLKTTITISIYNFHSCCVYQMIGLQKCFEGCSVRFCFQPCFVVQKDASDLVRCLCQCTSDLGKRAGRTVIAGLLVGSLPDLLKISKAVSRILWSRFMMVYVVKSLEAFSVWLGLVVVGLSSLLSSWVATTQVWRRYGTPEEARKFFSVSDSSQVFLFWQWFHIMLCRSTCFVELVSQWVRELFS